jgi:assimilatory nitrate reductase catalytic subunit
MSVRDGELAHVASPHGACVLKVVVTESQRRGSLFAPIHWNDETASCARIGSLIGAATDPHSGQPELKATPVAIAPAPYASRGFVLARDNLPMPQSSWWARVAVQGGIGRLFASNEPVTAWQGYAARWFAGAETVEYLDAARGIYRVAALAEDRLQACLFIGPAEAAPQWDAVKRLLGEGRLDGLQRGALLSGRSADGVADVGPIVCACFGVGLVAIRNALTSGAAVNVEQIRATLRAGSNCGSCLPEIKRIVAHERVAEPV